MTDDLAKYEVLAFSASERALEVKSEYDHGVLTDCADAITELVAMVRQAHDDAFSKYADNCLELKLKYEDAVDNIVKRAEAAERELAELKRKMREPDNELIVLMVDTYFSSRPDTEDDDDFRAVWLAGVNHLLGERNDD